jgi:hypothetical protein
MIYDFIMAVWQGIGLALGVIVGVGLVGLLTILVLWLIETVNSVIRQTGATRKR